jgi:hypothetical protein
LAAGSAKTVRRTFTVMAPVEQDARAFSGGYLGRGDIQFSSRIDFIVSVAMPWGLW